MIFKTFNNDLIAFNKTLISTRNNLDTIRTLNTTVYNRTGESFNLKGLTVNSTQSVSNFNKINNALKSYNNNLSQSAQLQNAYISAIGNQNTALGNYLAGLKGAKASLGGYIKSLINTKTATIGLQVASVALNTALSVGLCMGISALVSQISKWVNAQKEAKELAKETSSAFDAANSSIKENGTWIETNITRYEELSKKVNSLGKTVYLTDEEFKEYNSLTNEIADMFPELIIGYTDSGDAILSCKNNVELLTQAYENQKQAALDAIDTHALWEGFTSDTKDTPFFDNYGMSKNKEYSILQDILNGKYADLDVGSINQIFKNAGIDPLGLITSNEKIKEAIDSNMQLLYSYKRQLETDFKSSANQNISPMIEKYLGTNEDFQKLDETVQNEIKQITKNLGYEFYNGFNTEAEIIDWIDNIVIPALSNQKLQDALNQLFTADPSSMSVSEYVNLVNSTIEDVSKAINGDASKIKVNLGFDIEADEASLTGLKEKLSGINGGAKNQDAAKWVDTLTKEELEFAHSDEFINALEEQKKQLGNASLQAYDYENALNKVKSAQSKLGDSSEATDFTKFLEILGDEAIDDYQDKLSSLKSYLDKLKSGDFSSADELSLAKDFKITGDSIEELTEKVQNLMDSELDSIIKQIDEILNTENLDEETRKQVENLRESLIGVNQEAQNLNTALSLKTGNALADVQSLSQGLDQLDKIYADILDKEDFDWSSILNNDGFKEAFGAYTEEYENFINTVSASPNDINACQDAFNKLTAAYIKGSGVLSEVTEATKQQTINMLKQMGVANAASVVEQALIENEKMLEAQKYATSQGCKDLEKATYEEINALIAEGETTEEVMKYLAKLALEKWKANKEELKTQADCDNLLNLAKYAGATTEQIKDLKNAMADLNTFDFTNPMGSMVGSAFDNFYESALEKMPGLKKNPLFKNFEKNKKKQDSAQKSISDTMEEIEKQLLADLNVPEFKVDYSGGTTTKDTRERLAKEKEKQDKKNEETAETIDFMDIKLNNFLDTVSKAKDKISDLLSFGSKKKQTQKAIEATTKALEAEYKAMKKYAEVAKTLSADAAKETTETVTETVSGAVSDAVSNVTSSVASDVVAEAMKYVGVLDYVWDGTSLTSGADCSGFVQQVYKKLGMNIPRNTTGQYGDPNSISVSKADLQPGDLVFFQGSLGSPGNPRHVGIYAGNGQFIDSPTTGKKVQITSLSRRSDYIGAKRYAGASSAPVGSSVSYDTLSTTKTYTKVVPGIDSKTLAHYQKLVREGSFDVETITNEKLKNAIKSYQEWYEKMKSCRDKIEELNNTLRELYQTMAQIPIEKRDKNVDTLETRLDIINSKRDNINAVIVDPKKYASTKKTLKQSKANVKKGIKTKAQRNASGLTKTEISKIKDQMKKGQTIPAKILDKITDGAFYETCKQYNDAVYNHSQYAKSMRTAGQSIKKYNTLSDQILDAEKSKTKQYKTAYNDISKSYGKSLDNVKSKGNATKKAFGSKKYGLSNADINRIKSCIKSGKQIPTDLMVQLESQSVYDSCLEYNKAVMENEAFREELDNARFDLQKQQQAETAARLQVKTEKHQNIADKASAKAERNEALAENADTPAKKNKYLKKNVDLTKTEYKHLIEIAKLRNDEIEATRLQAEMEKELADNLAQRYQNIEDYYSDKRDKIARRTNYLDALNSNALSVDAKNQNLRDQTTQAIKDAETYEAAYKETAADFNVGRTSAMKSVKKVKGLSQSVKDKVVSLVKSKSEIPDDLLEKVREYDADAYYELVDYNNSLDWLTKAWWGMQTAEQERIYAERENLVQQHQNNADHAQAKIDRNDALSDISTSASERNKYEKENIKQLNTQYSNLLAIAKLHEDEEEYARLEAEQQAKIAESYKKMFDNVQTEYENKISLISNDISDLDNEMKKVEASGRLVDASYYNQKIAMENQTLAQLKEEESSLVGQLKNVKMFSPAWYECQDAIQSVQNAQADSLASIKDYKDAINEIADTIQNDIVDAFHDITNEADLLITLLGDNLSDSDTGALTEDGLAVLSLYVSQMNVCGEAAESARRQIDSMKAALESGSLSFVDANGIQREYESVYELKKALSEIQKIHMDEIKHKYDYGSKIVDMMVKKYQAELDYLKELIEQKKKALSLEQDLYEYSKNIQKQTDNINSLRKQIAALQGDTSKETESRIQKLQSQLKDAESSLEDQEYERFISDSQDMLDNLYNEYAKLVEDVMNDHDRLLKEALDLFAQTGADVQDVIRITAEEHGYEMTAEMEKIISSIEGMGSLDTYLGVGGTITQSLGDIVNEVHNAYVGLSSDILSMKDAVASIGYQGRYDTSDMDNTDNKVYTNTDSSPGSNLGTDSGSNSGTSGSNTDNTKDTEALIDHLLRNGTNVYDPKTTSSLNRYIYSKYGSALTVDEMAKLSGYLGFNYTPAQLAIEDKNHSKRKMKMLDELKVHGFSNGGIVPDDALKVKDIGIKPASNGDDRLVALQPKESVFNEKQTKMIQEYANKAPDLKTLMSMGNVMDRFINNPDIHPTPRETSVKVEYDNVNINLPNVMSYEDFMTRAQGDPKFSKFINCITASYMGVGNPMKKYGCSFRN